MSSIQELPARTLYGIEVRAAGMSSREIEKLWKRFCDEGIADDIPERADEKLIAAYHSYAGDQSQPFTYFLGCEVIDVCCVEEGFALREVPAGAYAHFSESGNRPEASHQAWQRILAEQLRRTYALDFEVYDSDSADAIDVYIGVH